MITAEEMMELFKACVSDPKKPNKILIGKREEKLMIKKIGKNNYINWLNDNL